MATFVTDAAIKSKIQGIIGKASLAEVAAKFDGFIAQSNPKAYNEIISVLRGRGFTLAQIGGWLRREEFNLDLGTFWTLTDAGLYNADNHVHRAYDRRKELLTVTLLDESAEVIEAGALDEVGAVAYGRMDQDFRKATLADEYSSFREIRDHW